MGIILGIDVGGSTTKIVGVKDGIVLAEPLMVKANDPVASLYGAFGKFTAVNKISLSDIERLMITGVGSSYVSEAVYDLPTEHVTEFVAIGRGGQHLSGLKEMIVASMGTGSALVYANEKGETLYLGGSGVGGGTLIGLSKLLLSMEDVNQIELLAEEGSLSRIDLVVNEMTSKSIDSLNSDLTASNFGKVNDLTAKGDVALGIINMIFETVAMLAIFAARHRKVENIVLTGRLSTLLQAERIFKKLSDTFDVNFCLPTRGEYATAIGAALTYYSNRG